MRTCACLGMATRGKLVGLGWKRAKLMAYRRVKFEKAKQTISSTNEDHYQVRYFLFGPGELADGDHDSQKVTAFSRTEPTLLAIGSTNSQLSVLSYPQFEEVFPSIEYEGEEIYDVDFDDSGEMVSSLAAKAWNWS